MNAHLCQQEHPYCVDLYLRVIRTNLVLLQTERSTHGRSYSDDEEDMEEACDNLAAPALAPPLPPHAPAANALLPLQARKKEVVSIQWPPTHTRHFVIKLKSEHMRKSS